MAEPNVRAEVTDFVNRLYRSQEGYVYAPTLNRESGVWRTHFYLWPNEKDRLVSDIVSQAATLDVYIGPCMYKEPTEPDKPNILGSHVVFTETDGEYDPQGSPAKPSFYLLSSEQKDHIHFYWEMESFCTDFTKIESINKAIAYSMRADTSVWDSTQVLRPPLTYNHKRGQRVSQLHKNPAARHNFWNTFADLKVPEEYDAEVTDASVGELPDPRMVMAKYPLPQGLTELLYANVAEGKRSEALMKIGYYGAELEMSDTEIYALLYNAALRWGKFKHHQNPLKTLRGIIKRARAKYPLNGMPVDKPYAMYGFDTFLREQFQVEWVIENLLAVQTIMVWSGKAGVGKTQSAIQAGIHLALGRNFMTWTVKRQWKILFVSQEMSYPPLHSILTKIADGMDLSPTERSTLQEHFLITKVDKSAFHLSSTEGQRVLEDMVKEHRPDGIIIDSMGQIAPGDLNDDQVIRSTLNYLDDLATRENLFAWIIHHNRKAQSTNKKPNSLDDIYGSQYIGAIASTVVSMWSGKSTDRVKEVYIAKNRLGEARTYYWKHGDDLIFRPLESGLPEVGSDKEAADLVADLTGKTKPAEKQGGLSIGEQFEDDDL